MARNKYQLSDAAFRALDEILTGDAFTTDQPSFILHDVLAYLKSLPDLTNDERFLKAELQSMSADERERVSRTLATDRRK